jgi:hypothetical protein
MQFLLLFKADGSLFDRSELERVFRSNTHFRDVRFDTPVGDLIECEYVDADDSTLIHLGKDRESVFLNHTWGAALRAVLAIQQSLGIPMRLFNDDYTFDLTFSDISTVEELEAAMENARTT